MVSPVVALQRVAVARVDRRSAGGIADACRVDQRIRIQRRRECNGDAVRQVVARACGNARACRRECASARTAADRSARRVACRNARRNACQCHAARKIVGDVDAGRIRRTCVAHLHDVRCRAARRVSEAAVVFRDRQRGDCLACRCICRRVRRRIRRIVYARRIR